MKRVFSDWAKFDIILLFVSLITIVTVGIIFNSTLLTIICSITGILGALTQAKGKIISQFIGIVVVFLYSIISFQNKFFGEVLIYIFIMFPLFVLGIISWIKNMNKKTKIVNENVLKKNEWILFIMYPMEWTLKKRVSSHWVYFCV